MKKRLLPVLSILYLMLSTVSVFASETTGSPAPTDDAGNNAGNGGWQQIIVIVGYLAIIVLAFYFLIIRPNKKRKKQEEELRGNLTLGDEIVTIGGIVGRVVNIKDDDITIETSLDKTLMQFKNWAIREIKKPETDLTTTNK